MYAEMDPGLRQTDMINALAAEYLQRDQNEQALRMFQCARLRRPWETTAYVGLAKCLMALGQPNKALESMNQALRIAPRDAELLEIRRTLARSRGEGL